MSKFLYLAQVQCLVMFTLKIILKNVQKLNVCHHYVQNVFQSGAGQEAMLLASKVSLDLHYGHNVNYLVNDKSLSENSNVCTGNSPPFSHVLFNYVCEKSDLFSKQEHSRERSTRSDEFSIEDAKDASVSYIKKLWEAIDSRLCFTDISNSPCAFSEAPAESIFSVYANVTCAREKMTIAHAVGLTRIAVHGPPPATTPSAMLAKEALKNVKSSFGERFCTKLWFKGCTSSTLKALKNKTWDW